MSKAILKLLLPVILFPAMSYSTILEVSATDSISIASNNDTYVLMTGMKFTNPASDDYWLDWSGSFGGNDVSENILVAVFLGGSIVQVTERKFRVENSLSDISTEYHLAISYHISPNGSQDVEIRWKYTSASGTATIRARSMVLVPGTSGDFKQVGLTAPDTVSSSTYVVMTGTELIDPGVGTYVVAFTASVRSDTSENDGKVQFAIFVAGDTLNHTQRIGGNENSWGPDAYSGISIYCKAVTTSSTDDIEVKWQVKQSAGAATYTVEDRVFVALKVATGDIFEATATSNATSTSNSDELINSMTLTPGAGPWLGMFSMSTHHGTIGGGDIDVEYSFYVNDVRVVDTAREQDHDQSFDSDTQWNAVTTGLVEPTAGQTVKAEWKSDRDPGETRTGGPRTMVLFREASAAATGRRDRIRLSSIENFGAILIFLFIGFAFNRFYNVVK